MSYDALNRLTVRRVPQVMYSSRSGIIQATAFIVENPYGPERDTSYPRYPNEPLGCQVVNSRHYCSRIIWPGKYFSYDRPPGNPLYWHGSLIEDKKDPVGTHYRRNRYYDPKSGRFTQEDPIGLAGGLNLYGFAGGDPVNFSDPFGLNPIGKIIALTVRGFKTVMKKVPEDALVEAARAGDDMILPSQQAASQVARAASGGRRPVGPESHILPGGQRGRPHYHVAGRTSPSHIFFSAAAGLTLSHWAKDASPMVQRAAAVGDFFNPLSLLDDLIQAGRDIKEIMQPPPSPPPSQQPE